MPRIPDVQPETTFLEWLLEELIGEAPTIRRGDGESQWPCPMCGHERFHTMPDKPGYRHRARCWTCEFRGDSPDMLRWFRPVEGETYPQLLQRLDKLKVRYEREAKKPVSNNTGGLAGQKPQDERAMMVALDDLDLLAQEPTPQWATGPNRCRIALFRVLAHAADIAWRNGLSLDDVAHACACGVLDYRDMLREHASRCNDPSCGSACRRLRGLPPLKRPKRRAERV